MSKYIGEKETANFIKTEGSVKIGYTTPSRKTKGSYFEVYYNPGLNMIVAAVLVDDEWCDVVCGEVITLEELPMYMEACPDEAIDYMECLRESLKNN